MLNYIRADVKRILQRSSHLFSMLLAFIAYAVALYFNNNDPQVTSANLISSACGILEWLPVFVGLFELIAVFSEDFKVKTMQVAIGRGISRNKVVLCKLSEVIFMLVLDSIVFLLLTFGVGAMKGLSIAPALLGDLVCALFVKCLLAQLTASSLTMIVLFVTHSSILSIFVYVFVAVDVVNLLLTLMPMFGFTWIESLNLNRLTLTYHLSLFYSHLVLGTFETISLLVIAAFTGVGVFATCKLFSKRELDF